MKKISNTKEEKSEIENSHFTFPTSGTQSVEFHTGTMILSRFYSIRSLKKKLIVAFLMGIFFAVFSLFLIENSGLYSGGATAFFQGIARLINSLLSSKTVLGSDTSYYEHLLLIIYNLLFWGLYLLFNISLMFIFWKKLDRQFMLLSLTYIMTAQIVGTILSASIPGIEKVFILGDTTNVNGNLAAANVQSIIFQPNIYPSLSPNMSWDWENPLFPGDTNLKELTIISINNENITRAFDLFLYAVAFSLVSSITNSVLYSMGGSTAGTELISLYMSEKKNTDVGHILRLIHIVCMFTGIMLGSYISGIAACPDYASTYASWQYIFSANLVASIIWIFLNSMLVNILYPSKKMVQLQIFTNKVDEILNKLNDVKYPHPTTIINTIGGYSRTQNNILTIICPVSRMNVTVRIIRSVDARCLISITDMKDVDGTISVKRHVKTKAEIEEANKNKKKNKAKPKKNEKTK